MESTPGEGTTFIVRLPLVPVAQEGRGKREGRERTEEPRRKRLSAAQSPVSVGAGEGERVGEDGQKEALKETVNAEGATVLVVEDNAEMQAYLREQLSSRWQVLEASDGEQGWQVVQEAQPDLVLSDVMMPQVDGIELCRRIKEDDELRAIPVLLLTARTSDDAALEGLGVGADDYIAKPFNVAELKQRVANHLAARVHLRNQHREEIHLPSLGAVADEEDLPFIEEVIEVIEEHLSNPDFTVGQLAEAVALSRRQLARRVKDALGEPPGTFIRHCRIERAKAYLAREPETVAEVAHATGFRSPSAFSQAFREEVGCSPSEYLEGGT